MTVYHRPKNKWKYVESQSKFLLRSCLNLGILKIVISNEIFIQNSFGFESGHSMASTFDILKVLVHRAIVKVPLGPNRVLDTDIMVDILKMLVKWFGWSVSPQTNPLSAFRCARCKSTLVYVCVDAVSRDPRPGDSLARGTRTGRHRKPRKPFAN